MGPQAPDSRLKHIATPLKPYKRLTESGPPWVLNEGYTKNVECYMQILSVYRSIICVHLINMWALSTAKKMVGEF